MYAKDYENPAMLSKVTAKNVGDVFFETHCIYTPTETIFSIVLCRVAHVGYALLCELMSL